MLIDVILEKIDIESIAEQIYSLLEYDIINEVTQEIDINEVVENLVKGYKDEFKETMKDSIKEKIYEHIELSEIKRELRSVVEYNLF